MKGKKENRKFINITSISKHLQCTICQDIFYDPIRFMCGHTFCSGCIDKWLKSSSSCPICREELFDSGKDLIAFNIINDLPVLCIHQNCPWRAPLVQLDNHLKSCYFNPKKLPDCVKKAFIEEDKNKVINEDKKESVLKEGDEPQIDLNENENIKFNLCTSLKARLYQKNPSLMNNVFQSGKDSTALTMKNSSNDFLIKYLDEKKEKENKGDNEQSLEEKRSIVNTDKEI